MITQLSTQPAAFVPFVVLAPDDVHATTGMLHLTKLFPGLGIFKY